MLSPEQVGFAQQMLQAAKDSGHIFPDYAAAEACLESAWGASGLCQRAMNVFGLKAPHDWTGPTIEIETREVIKGQSVMVPATWPVFESYIAAFAERLNRLAAMPSTYGEALMAPDGLEFVRLVSASWLTGDAFPVGPAHPVFTFPSGTYQFGGGRWSTDPARAIRVIGTHNSHPEIFGVQS